tara:strand:+ start:354 stop:887 length:534 start_codon:yes stop_codon:yes gene_type:complete
MRKFIEAAFLNAERSVVEVLWQDGDEIYSDHIQVDPKQKTYTGFLEEANINFDDIIEMTAVRRRQERRDFELAAIAIGQEEGWIPKEQTSEKVSKQGGLKIQTEKDIREKIYADISDMIFSDEVPKDRKVKEFMFMTKLQLFEQQKVKDSKDTKTKSALRKAKTPLEMMELAVKLMK